MHRPNKFCPVILYFSKHKIIKMKSLIICCTAMFITCAAFSQKAKANADTTLKAYFTYSCSMHPEYVSNVAAKCPVCSNTMALSKKEQLKMEVMNLYTCPMHPDVKCTKAGKCPSCNMDMVEFKPKSKAKKINLFSGTRVALQLSWCFTLNLTR